MANQKSEIVIYKAEDGRSTIDVRLEEETVWLTQKQMAELFQKTLPNINIHIKSIYRENELDPHSTIKESLIVQTEGKRTISRKIELYNLDVIISVGYRVKSKRGTQFRIWATNVLRDHLVKGKQPIIITLARGLKKRFEPEFAKVLTTNRVFIVTPFNQFFL